MKFEEYYVKDTGEIVMGSGQLQALLYSIIIQFPDAKKMEFLHNIDPVNYFELDFFRDDILGIIIEHLVTVNQKLMSTDWFKRMTGIVFTRRPDAVKIPGIATNFYLHPISFVE